MLGMSRAELCQGICDQKTLVRLENKKTNSQKAVVVELFERLGLAGTLSRTVLVTERPEVRRLIITFDESYFKEMLQHGTK